MFASRCRRLPHLYLSGPPLSLSIVIFSSVALPTGGQLSRNQSIIVRSPSSTCLLSWAMAH